MDAAPLINAQSTARHASSSEQHEKAALEYSTAAEGVEDAEALRILSLLEKHHQHLARIVKAQTSAGQTTPQLDGTNPTKVAETTVTTDQEAQPATPELSQTQTQAQTGRRPPSPVLQRRPARDVSSTIATDLAAARGIPNNQQRNARQSSPVASVKSTASRPVSRQQNPRGPASPRTPVAPDQGQKTSAVKPDEAPLVTTPGKGQAQSHQDSPTEKGSKEEAFQKFYSTFEGLLSKLSAPLAFAGLPLVPDDQSSNTTAADNSNASDKSTTSPRAKPRHSETSATTAAALNRSTPDVTKLISPAALRAIREDDPGFGRGGVHESFFVVPTTGGTVSYANILSRQERQAREHASDFGEGDENDGNDAGATPDEHYSAAKSSLRHNQQQPSRSSTTKEGRNTSSPTTTGTGKSPRAGSKSTSTSKKTVEELELENESLKQLTDNLSRRLYMWEKSAQSQSMALQQSIRTLHPPQTPSTTASMVQGGGGTGEQQQQGVDARLRNLEEQLASAKKEMQRYERENEKLKTVVARYRERWEKLKEGARVRREGGGTDTNKGAGPTGGAEAAD